MKRILLFFGIALLFNACNQDAGPFVVFNVETDYRLDLREKLSETKKELLLEIGTEIVNFTCEDAEIVTQSSIVGGEIKIDIKEIRLPADCSENGNFPAKTYLNLGTLETGGYKLTISIGEALFNYGSLQVTDLGYEMIFEEELNGIEIPKPELTKIPHGTIWSRLKYDNNTGVSALLSDFENQLVGIGAAGKTLTPGNYTNFEINTEEIWSWTEENTFTNENSVVYTYSGSNLGSLGGIVDSINTEYGAMYEFELDVFTYTGLEY